MRRQGGSVCSWAGLLGSPLPMGSLRRPPRFSPVAPRFYENVALPLETPATLEATDHLGSDKSFSALPLLAR